MNKAQRDIRRKKRVVEHAARIGNVRKTCRYFGVARSGFYVWKKAYETQGDEGLVNQKPCPYNPRLRTPPDIVALLHERPSAGGAVWPAFLVSAGATLQGCSRRFIPRIRRNTAWRIGRPTTGSSFAAAM